MTREEIKKLQDWISTLTGDELAGASDALSAIAAARMGGGGGGSTPPPPITEIDPELDDPEHLDDPDADEDDDLEIDDPDDVLEKKKSKDKSEEDDSKEDKKDEKSEDDDGSGDADKESKDDGEGAVDDETDLPDELSKDAKEEEAKKSEIFRRKVEIASAKKQVRRAMKKIEAGSVTPTAEEEEQISKAMEDLDKLAKELTDNPDSVKDMSADEFNKLIEAILDLTDKLGVHHKKLDDVKSRMKKIKDDMEDEFLADAMADEDAANKLKDPEFQKMKASEREKERLKRELEAELSASSPFRGDIETFKVDIKKAIGDQISEMIEVEEQTYAVVNRWHEDDDIAVPGIRIDEIPEYKKPSIDVYIDQSGSWTADDVKRGLAAVADMFQLEKEGMIQITPWFFSAILSQNQAAARARGEYECWDLIINQIDSAPKTKNVVIITDTDIEHNWHAPGCHGCVDGPGTTVEGCVWYLWKNGRRVSTASKKLKGMKGTFEYSI